MLCVFSHVLCVFTYFFLCPSVCLSFHYSIHQYLIGKIPLRHLVYRVLDLPPSMRPLVYDFGQLNLETEKDYIWQIVSDRCQDILLVTYSHTCSTTLVDSIAHVLAWSQKFMRERTVKKFLAFFACSFQYFLPLYRMSAVLWVSGMWKEPWLCLSTFVPSYQI